jgi:hypothetical protein
MDAIFGAGMRHDDCNSGISARTDCSEKISIFATLILWLARSRALLRHGFSRISAHPLPLAQDAQAIAAFS